MSFGAKIPPQEWCIGLEIYIDLVNKLPVFPEWNPLDLSSLDSAHTPPNRRQFSPPVG